VLESLLERVGSADGTVPICAISGTAGVGKTSLALHWAHQVAHGFPDGQLYVNLRGFGPTSEPVRAADAIRGFLDALEARRDRRPAGSEAQAALYRSVLASKRMLIVLDNAADEEQVRPLLPGSDGCLVIVTSRRRLAGLAAREGATLVSLEVMSQPEALELLAERLGNELTAISPETANQLVSLCGRLPLALSIAAARAAENPNLDLAALAARMQDIGGRLDVLDVGERASSLRAVLSWSYENVSRPAARMLRLLAVHPGPDIGIAAAASLAGCHVDEVRRVLAELARAHVIAEHVPDRWVLRDLMRAYASEQARSGEQADRDAAIHRMLDHYLHTAWSAAVALRPGRDPAFALLAPHTGAGPQSLTGTARAVAWFEAEHQVLLALTSWAVAAGFDGYAWRLPWALVDYLSMSGRSLEHTASMRTALEAAARAGDMAGQARAHHGLGGPFSTNPAAASHLGQALRLYQALDERAGQAAVRFSLAIVFANKGRTQAALREGEQALLLARASEHRGHEADALNLIGWLHAELGHYDLARIRCRQALALHSADGHRFGLAATLDSLGYIEHQLGHYAKAEDYYQRALQVPAEVTWRCTRAAIFDHLGDSRAAAAGPAAAREFWQQAVAILDRLGGVDTSPIRQKLSA